jgi:hypothetical protein
MSHAPDGSPLRCHSTPPYMPGWRPPVMPLRDEMPHRPELDPPPPMPGAPEPADHGPPPHVVLH